MTAATASLTSRVLTPGATAARPAAMASASNRPAARIACSSPRDLSWIVSAMDSRHRLLAEGLARPRLHLVDAADAVDGHQLVGVVVEQRLGLLVVQLQPPADRLGGVVGPAPGEHPIQQHAVRDLEQQHLVDVLVALDQDLAQLVGLDHGPWETVEEEALGCVRL